MESTTPGNKAKSADAVSTAEERSASWRRPFKRLSLLCALLGAGASALLAVSPSSGPVFVFPPWANVAASGSQQFVALVGSTIKLATSDDVVWSVNGVPGGNAALGTISSSGLYTAPNTPPTQYSLNISASTIASPVQAAASSLWVFNGVVLNVYPKRSLLGAGKSLQIYPRVSGTSNTSVNWRVQGGDAFGAITSSGLYTAPSEAPSGVVTIICQSNADPSRTDTTQVGVLSPQSGIAVNVSPSAATINAGEQQQFSASVTGGTNSSVTWSLSPAIGSVSPSGLYTAPASVASETMVTITAASLAQPSVVDTATLTIEPNVVNPVSVNVSPTSKSLDAGQSQQFSATVSGSTNGAVRWTVNPAAGSVSSSGLYTAPASVGSAQNVSILATSVASPDASGAASVTVFPAVSVATIGLPGAVAGAAFSAGLTASGGLAPYTWRLSAGSTPSGIALSNAGVLTGLPSQTGTFSFTVAVSDANGGAASKPFSLTVSPATTGTLGVLTNSLAMGNIGQTYAGTLAASGGSAPYTWSVSGGALPAGVSLNPSTGVLSGTPTNSGQFPVTFRVQDANNASGNKTFNLSVLEVVEDQYGGFTSLPCPNGPQANFYTQKIGKRWHLCTPAGNAFWMNSVYNADASDSGTDYQGNVLSNLVQSKYASGFTGNSTLNWGLQTVRRLKSWGFTSLAEYANAWTLPIATNGDWTTPDASIPVKLPFVGYTAASLYSLSNGGNYANGPVKDLMAGVKTSVYGGYRSQAVDYWDPNFAQWLSNDLSNDYWTVRSMTASYHDYQIAMVVDDTDNLQGFGAGPDFPTVAYGVVSPGYDQPHLGWVILVTASTQSSNSTWGATYTNTTVYSKQKLSSWLSSKYNGNIAALNAAWGSSYTTFGSAGGWGTGSGVLDEDGTCPSRAGSPCWVPTDAFTLNGATTAMQNDLNAFLLFHAQNYFSTVKSALSQKLPGVLYGGPTTLGTWGTPARREILQAASQYVDVLGVATIPPLCSNCTDLQQRIDFIGTYFGDKPWASWEGFPANADSYMSPYATPQDEFSTQAQRGQAYQQRVQQLVSAADSSTGTYHLVGFKWWDLYDMRGESTNWGLLTPRDDPYDGVSATKTPGADPWGYPTGCVNGYGCEQGNYGDFIDAVQSANISAIRTIASGK